MFLSKRVTCAFGVCTGVFVFCCVLSVSAGQSIRFSDSWKFYQGTPSGAPSGSGFDDAAWETVYLPHTVRLETVGSANNYLGICWYRKTFTPNTLWNGQKLYLEFEAAMQTALVYINGTPIATHQGGYDPFVLDITGNVVFGSSNVIAVQLDNNASSSFPPGNTNPDFRYYGGLYRNVNLLVSDPLHITNPLVADIVAGGGIFVTYSAVSTLSATVQVATHVINEFTTMKSCIVTTTLFDPTGAQVGTPNSSAINLNANASNTFTQSFTVSNPQLWHPDHPYLYSVKSQIYDGARLADTLTTAIGIRTITFSKATGFQINSQRYIFRGADRHQDYPYIGNAVPNSGQYRDALRLKEQGFTFVRMSHYIQAKAFVDACDKLGILTMACLPGWQYFNNNATFINNSIAVLRTMVRYYRNHPSVILWESMHNETYGSTTVAFLNAAQAAAHAEYPGNQMFTCGEENQNGTTNATFDLFMGSGQHGVMTYGGSRPCVISEYGDWEFGGYTSTSRVDRSQGEAAMLTQAGNFSGLNSGSSGYTGLSPQMALSWITGSAVWIGLDYQAWSNDPLCSAGALDIYRLPKFSAYFYQSQRDPSVVISGVNSGPMVFIASLWNTSSALSPLQVYSNCDHVSLYLNGTAIASNQTPRTGTNLVHPMYTITIPAFQSGTLRADGFIGGILRASDTVITPGTATKVVVVIDTANQIFQADGSDIALVYGLIEDANNTVIPNASTSVTFTVSGTSTARLITTTIATSQTVAAQAGIATVLLRAGTVGGLITVGATATGLTGGSDTVTSVAPPTTGITDPFRPAAVRAQDRVFVIRQKGSVVSVQVPSAAVQGHSAAKFTLCNAQGRVVGRWNLTKSVTQVSIKALPHGLYLGQINGGTNLFVKKVVW